MHVIPVPIDTPDFAGFSPLKVVYYRVLRSRSCADVEGIRHDRHFVADIGDKAKTGRLFYNFIFTVDLPVKDIVIARVAALAPEIEKAAILGQNPDSGAERRLDDDITFRAGAEIDTPGVKEGNSAEEEAEGIMGQIPVYRTEMWPMPAVPWSMSEITIRSIPARISRAVPKTGRLFRSWPISFRKDYRSVKIFTWWTGFIP